MRGLDWIDWMDLMLGLDCIDLMLGLDCIDYAWTASYLMPGLDYRLDCIDV